MIMKFSRKTILFSMLGLCAAIPITSEASLTISALANMAKHAVQEHAPSPTSSSKYNSPIQSQSATDVKTPGQCTQHYPLGAPMVVAVEKDKISRRSFYLCQEDYAVQFDPQTKTPIWVSEHLNGREQAGERIERVDNFQPNPNIPTPAQASLNDYKGSHFDRGHNAPAADMRTDHAMEQSFYLTNMFPQVGPNMNRGIWAELEAMARKWSISRGEILVVTGPIFSQQHATMGKSKVWVPTELYKVILDPKTGESLAFIMPNVQVVTRKTHKLDDGNSIYPQTTPQMAVNCGRQCIIDDFIVPMNVVEEKTGLKFFPQLNQQLRQISEQKGRMWSAKY